MDDVLPGLTISSGDGLVVVSGEVDAHTAATLEVHLAAEPVDRPLRLDLSAVTFMDSSGLRVLIDTHQRTAGAEPGLTIVRPSRAVVRLLEISGLDDHLHIDPS
jgi:anti-sigma B factor antagonist